MTPPYIQVLPYYRKLIARSGLIIDEDLTFMNNARWTEQTNRMNIPNKFLLLFGVAVGAFTILQKERSHTLIAATSLFTFPMLSYVCTLYNRRKARILRKIIEELVAAFKNLSISHREVFLFMKRYEKTLNTLKEPILSEDSILELGKSLYYVQYSVTQLILTIVFKLHAGLKDLSFNLTEFQRAASVRLTYNTIKDCLFAADFIEGQIILMRSHLLICIYMMCSTGGNPKLLTEVMEESIPPLVVMLNSSVSELKLKLHSVRFPAQPTTLNLARIENILAQKNIICLPRMKKNILQINDRVCCTLLKLRAVLVTLENIQSEDQMILLEKAVSVLNDELFQCYASSADLKKLLEVLNRNYSRRPLAANDPQSLNEEEIIDSKVQEEPQEEKPMEDSEYQTFETNISSDNDEEITFSESRAISVYQEFMRDESELLIELQQHEEFKRRQNKFKMVRSTYKPTDSEIVSPSRSIFMKDVTPVTDLSSQLMPPPPPPLPPISEPSYGENALASSSDTSICSYKTAPDTEGFMKFQGRSTSTPAGSEGVDVFGSPSELEDISSIHESSESSVELMRPPPPPIPPPMLDQSSGSDSIFLTSSANSEPMKMTSSADTTSPSYKTALDNEELYVFFKGNKKHKVYDDSSLPPIIPVEESSLKKSLKGALAKIYQSQEDTYE